MALSDLVPSIDDRRFRDLVEEMRVRVPRYAPEWTDLNDNEPGMAILQTYAWLADMMLFRIGQVPEQNYLRFLELFGVGLLPATPATAGVRFPIKPTATTEVVLIPERTQVSAPGADGTPVIFETRRSAAILRAQLDAVQVADGGSFNAVTFDATTSFRAFGSIAAVDSALLLGLSDPGPLPAATIQVTLSVHAGGRDAAVSCASVGARDTAPATIIWEAWSTTGWRGLQVVRDDTSTFTRSGAISLKLPPAGTLQQSTLGEFVDRPRFWLRARISGGGFPTPPVLDAVAIDTVDMEQAETVFDEVLGGSDARPDQQFTLSRQPIVPGTLTLEIDEGDDQGFHEWTEVDDLYASGPDDRDFVLDAATGTVRFGDGRQGAIPGANIANRTGNIVAVSYRAGGGRRGNVGVGQITSVISTIAGVDTARVSNSFAAGGGRDTETLADAKRRAPSALRAQRRAVTADDFEALAREAANVKRAKALPLTHPMFPDTRVPGVVSVIVVPDAEGTHPVPTQETMRAVCAHLDERRLVTTETYVLAPRYREASVEVDVIVADFADLAAVEQDVTAALLAFLHPLTGGEEGDGWPFGGTISYSQLDRTIFSAPGVLSVERLIITVDDEEAAECRNVAIRPDELVYSEHHTVNVSYAVRA